MDAAKTVQLLEREEGFRAVPYFCSAGKRTFAIGYNIDARGNPVWWDGVSPCTHQQAITQLQADVHSIADSLDKYLSGLNNARQAVLISMAYQMGVPGLLKFKRTLKTIAAGRYAEAAGYMLASLWAKQTPSRAMRHAKQMETGEWQ